MVIGITLIILAFAWLMYETKFLTVHLLRYSKPPIVMGLMMGMISIVIGMGKFFLGMERMRNQTLPLLTLIAWMPLEIG